MGERGRVQPPGDHTDSYAPRGVDFCQADLADSTVTYLRCPDCGSDDCGCESTTEHHRHRCFDCGFETRSAARHV